MNAVYTALFGNYDDLLPINFDSKLKFICFTDNKSLLVKGWEVRYIKLCDLSYRDSNRHIKFKPHEYLPDYLYTLYVDSNIEIKKDPSYIFNKYSSFTDLAIPKHRIRNCLYKEINACVEAGLITELDVKPQFHKLLREGFPREYGLSENGIIFRKNTKIINNLMDAWWCHYISGVRRDQLSLSYLMWKMNINLSYMEETAFNCNDYFQYRIHKNNRRSGFRGKFSDFLLERKYKFRLLLYISKTLIFIKNIIIK